MGIFERRNKPMKDDLCICRHKYIEHDVNSGCTRMGCPCLTYFRPTRRFKESAKGKEEMSEYLPED